VQLERFKISVSATLREALHQIEQNHHGVAIAVDSMDCVVGLATDGDIRRELLKGRTLNDSISTCINTDFIFDSPSTPCHSIT
jgi:D-glycero-alpha-D-manno-heptose-7-phosphate kinase